MPSIVTTLFKFSVKKVKMHLPSTGELWVGAGQEEVKQLIHSLLAKALTSHLSRDQTVQVLGELAISHIELANLIPDVLWLVDIETSTGGKKEERARFLDIMKEVEQFLSEATLKERLEIDTLGDTGIVKHPKKFFSAFVKLKTKILCVNPDPNDDEH